jgi:hypothetical protein
LLIDQTSIWLAVIALVGTFLTGIFNTIQNYFRHKETMRQLEEVHKTVNGKMEELLEVSGNAREAIGRLAGKAEEKSGRN